MTTVGAPWPIVALFDFCNPKQWPTIPQTAFVEQGYPVYGANGKIGYYSDFNHEKPTVLITCRGATCGTINVCEPKSYVTGNAMALDDLDESRVSAAYLVYALRNESLAKAISGTAQPQITRQGLTAISIPLPPLPKQRQIAEILDKAEALRAKRRAALAQLETLTGAIFLKMFGDPTANPNGWPTASIASVASVVTGYPFRSDDYVSDRESIRLCRGANVLPGRIDWSDLARWPETNAEGLDEFWLEPRDVVIAMDRPWISDGFKIARLGIADCPCLLVQRVARIRANGGTSNDFIYYLLNNRAFTRHCRPTETTIPHISPNDIRSFTFPLPPAEVQTEFSRQARVVEALKTAHRASLAKLDALFVSLQHRAFRGEL